MVRKQKHEYLRQIRDEQNKIPRSMIWPLRTATGNYERSNKEAKSDDEVLDKIQ